MKKSRNILALLCVFLLAAVMLAACGGNDDDEAGNTAPVAYAGTDQSVLTGSLVTLSGDGDDAEGDSLTYSWSFSSRPGSSVSTLWNPTTVSPAFTADVAGIYVIGLVVDDGEDSSPADTVAITATDPAFTADAYAWAATTGDFVEVDLTTGALTTVQSYGSTGFMAGADFVDGRYLAVDYNDGTLYEYFADQPRTSLGIITGYSSSATGLAYDQTADVLFLCSSDGGSSYLYTIDPDDYSANLVGDISSPLIIGIAFDSTGQLYGIDLVNDNLVTINKGTGTASVIGSLGVDLNYAQDIAFDRDNATLYGTLYETSSAGGLYTINTTTGAANLVGAFEYELDGLAIPY